ncbi:hypothetical protein C5167_000062 [Papaver somniferum]|uniref:Glycine rich protein n=1 Tax=Papaver somniferum TaxID=3469 RepID=A0A4Y7KR58_PAPSO|nr:glycine-rich protein 3-like isoform X1 [Papaver somniferum]RZC75824.1 hypothetical protein C5167_000062 [Papaver somniferum]
MGTGNARIFILFGLLFAVVTLISSEVSAAKDLAAKTTEEETAEKNGLQDAKYGGNGGYPGNGGYQGGGGYPGNGGYQGGGGYPGNGGGYRNGGGYQGGGGRNGGGYRNGGGRGGGGYRCRHGCCDRGGYYRGGCYNCCYSAAQAKAFAAETTTVNNLKP